MVENILSSKSTKVWDQARIKLVASALHLQLDSLLVVVSMTV